MKFVVILFSLVAFNVSANEAVLDSIRSEKRSEGLYVIHKVDEKETLYSIAKRYGGDITQIIEHNKILYNTINIGQVLEVLVTQKMPEPTQQDPKEVDGVHLIKDGETLYSISKKYDVKVRELKKWNKLKGNEIAIGSPIKVSKNGDVSKFELSKEVPTSHEENPELKAPTKPAETYDSHKVQTGETLHSIARQHNIEIDSLKSWNGLTSNYLFIGQLLRVKKPENTSTASLGKNESTKGIMVNEKDSEKTYEEGIASFIESMNTSKYLALHATLPTGTKIEVRNLMNNQTVQAKVVGRLPKTGPNDNLLVRLSKSAYDQLGILDSKARVEVSYLKGQ